MSAIDQMSAVEQNLLAWKETLLSSIPVAGLLSRNPTVYKWKSMYRVWMIREAVFWRLHDLLTQSHILHQQQHGLGSRILLRSGYETLAVLIFLNKIMSQVVSKKTEFFEFEEKTRMLLLGSRDGTTEYKSLNILTILEKCDAKYPGIKRLYDRLSESAHPNFEGIVVGYSLSDREEYETKFSNRWMEIYGSDYLRTISLCMETFYEEYNQVWPPALESLEGWVDANDLTLEATRLRLEQNDAPKAQQ